MHVPDLTNDILSTLAYFDNFSYPLTEKEIILFLPNRYSKESVQLCLGELVSIQRIYQIEDYYSFSNDTAYANRRDEGYMKAMYLIAKGKRIAAMLADFPFVRGVAISGSLSKYFAEDDDDIDFFIITAGHRVWVARTFMHLLKKLSFLFNKQHLLCMNYYIDECALEILEQNIFTATETVTLMPLQGVDVFDAFARSNEWTTTFLPNHAMRNTARRSKGNLIKTIVEACLDGRLGEALDNWLMRITAKRWQAKAAALKTNDHGCILRMTAHKHYSKPDPGGFQETLLENYSQRLKTISTCTMWDVRCTKVI